MRISALLYSSLLLLLPSATSYGAEIYTILHASGNYPPYEMEGTGGQAIGFHFDIVDEVSRRAGLSPRYIRMPWRRAVVSIKNGMGDAILYTIPNAEREKFLWFLPENKLGLTILAYSVRAGHPLEGKKITNIAMLKPYRLGLATDYVYPPEVNASNFLSIDRNAKDDTSLLRLLLHGRVGVALLNTEVGRYISEQLDSDRQLRVLRPYYPPKPHYIAFSKTLNKKALAKKFANHYQQFKQTADYRALTKKYNLTPISTLD